MIEFKKILGASLVGLSLVAAGCAKKEVVSEAEASESKEVETYQSTTTNSSSEPMTKSSSEPMELTVWKVSSGENLWDISGKDDVYGQPLKWPLIYKENQNIIKDADLIYSGQVLVIPRRVLVSDIRNAVNHAKSRGSWVLGETENKDKVYLGE